LKPKFGICKVKRNEKKTIKQKWPRESGYTVKIMIITKNTRSWAALWKHLRCRNALKQTKWTS